MSINHVLFIGLVTVVLSLPVFVYSIYSFIQLINNTISASAALLKMICCAVYLITIFNTFGVMFFDSLNKYLEVV